MIEFKIVRLNQVMDIYVFGWAQSYIELASGVFWLGHIDPVYKDTLYSDSMNQKNTKSFTL